MNKPPPRLKFQSEMLTEGHNARGEETGGEDLKSHRAGAGWGDTKETRRVRRQQCVCARARGHSGSIRTLLPWEAAGAGAGAVSPCWGWGGGSVAPSPAGGITEL